MGLIYLICGFFVIACMLALPILPFYKVWKRLRDHHRDLWNGMGPFEVMDLITSSQTQKSFLRIIALAKEQETLQERDPELVKWTNVCNEFIKALPRGFGKQLFLAIILLFIASSFTTGLVSLFT